MRCRDDGLKDWNIYPAAGNNKLGSGNEDADSGDEVNALSTTEVSCYQYCPVILKTWSFVQLLHDYFIDEVSSY